MQISLNIILRLLTGEPPKQAQQALKLIQRAECGEVLLKISPLIIAEIVWVLISFYKQSRSEVANVLIPLFSTNGIFLEDCDQVLTALSVMANKNVDFADAFWLSLLGEIAAWSSLLIVISRG